MNTTITLPRRPCCTTTGMSQTFGRPKTLLSGLDTCSIQTIFAYQIHFRARGLVFLANSDIFTVLKITSGFVFL